MTTEIDQPAVEVFDAALTRRSIRAFKREPIAMQTLREIVALGRHAPSGSNIQPWRIELDDYAVFCDI